MAAFFASSPLFVTPLPSFAQATSSAVGETQKFRAYLDEDWKRWMQEYPEAATFFGFPGQNRLWTDNSRDGIEARIRHLHESLRGRESLGGEALAGGEQLNYDLYRKRLEMAEEGLQYADDPMPFQGVVPFSLWMPMTQMGGVQQSMPSTLAAMPHQTAADYEDILVRLETLPKHVEQHIELLREGLKRGYSPPKFMLRDVPKQIAGLIPADALASPLLEPFHKFPAGFLEAEKPRLTERAKQLYSIGIVPAIQKLHDYVAQTYMPACRESIATTALPNVAAAYAFHVRWQTTTSLTPQQIHDVGLSEVKRIRAEMDKVIASAGFNGSFHDFTEFLRTDERFYYEKPDHLAIGYRVTAKEIDPALDHL